MPGSPRTAASNGSNRTVRSGKRARRDDSSHTRGRERPLPGAPPALPAAPPDVEEGVRARALARDALSSSTDEAASAASWLRMGDAVRPRKRPPRRGGMARRG